MNSPVTGRLKDRVALITGGARGQGAAHAARLAAEGAIVHLADVLDTEGAETETDLRAGGFDATYLHLDVADPLSWRSASAGIQERHGHLDILVNNAGVFHEALIADEDLAAWNRLLGINLTGPFLGMHTMLPLLRRGTGAAVVNTSSVYGPAGAIGYAAYAASKSGLLGLTRTAALEFAPDGIRVNSLVPGGVTSAMSADDAAGDSGVLAYTPLRRRAAPHEMAAAVAYLVSDDASFVTGTELIVDGGFLAR